MKRKNMGSADRIIRTVLALAIGYLYFAGIVKGTAGVIMLIVGGVFLLTSIAGNCPLYSLLRIQTCSSKE